MSSSREDRACMMIERRKGVWPKRCWFFHFKAV
jgi:hypothetical protein